jgi:hypothetical protein
MSSTTTAEKVVLEAMSLPSVLRAFVAEKLIESLETPDSAPLTPIWRKELRRRCAEMDSGTAKVRDAESVFTKAYASLS